MELSEVDCKRFEQQEQFKKLKRRVNRHNRRVKDREYRDNIDKAFKFQDVEVIPPQDLRKKVDFKTFQKTGRLSSFPSEFYDWISCTGKFQP